MSKILLSILLSTFCFFVFAEVAPYLVVGIGNKKIPLEFNSEEGVKKSHPHWVKEPEKMMIVEFPVSKNWREGRFSFTPKESGSLLFILKTNPVRRGGDLLAMGCYFDNIKINGALVKNGNGDFEQGKNGFDFRSSLEYKEMSSRIVSDPRIAKSGNNCALVWYQGEIHLWYSVQKDVPVVFSCDYRDAGLIQPINQQDQFYPLSLASIANMGFADDVAGDGKGGWSDQGRSNDLRAFPSGVLSFSDYPFVILDPARNNGKSCVILKSSNSMYGSAGFTLPVNQVCNRLVLVLGAAWGTKGVHAADVMVNYANGKKEVFPLIAGKNFGDWWDLQRKLPEADLVWTGANAKALVGVYGLELKLSHPGKVRSVSITPTKKNSVALGIIGVTCADIKLQGKKNPLETIQVVTKLPKKSQLIALPLEHVKMEMRRQKLPADEFFDELINLNRIQAFDANGKRLKLAIAKYSRTLSPVILLHSEEKIDSVTLKLGKGQNEQIFTPLDALERIVGPRNLNVNDTPWANGIMLLPRDAILKNAKRVRDPDSFYLEAISFDPVGSEATFTIELKKPETVKLFAYMCHKRPKSQQNRINVFIDRKPVIVVGGFFYKPLSYYWCGGERIKLDAGKHTLKLLIPCNPQDRKDLNVAKFYLNFGLHAPEMPGYADEMEGLRQAGFTIAGDIPHISLKNIPSSDRLTRIVNAERSYPDLSSLVQNRIDEDGALHPCGTSMKFDSGREVPFIWGRNISHNNFYTMLKERRLGIPGATDRLMNRYKELGISCLRVFFFTMPRAHWTNINNYHMYLLDGKNLKFHDEYFELFHALIASAHKHGIYLSLTFGAYPWSFREISEESQAMFYDPRLIELQKKRINLLMDRPNPFRNGIRPADDPTILIVEIENEVNFRGGGQGKRQSWTTIADKDKNVLYPVWQNYLKHKYKTIAQLKKQWGKIPVRSGKTEETFENIELPPFGDIKEWGMDSSAFSVKMDDLRVSSASFGKEKRSNPQVSDAMEFMYRIYSQYLKTMYNHLRSLGFKGVITTCGPDTETFYLQRAAANSIVDAVSGGTSYWNCNGYRFIQSLYWLNPMVYAAAPEKPVISREYGPNLSSGENTWWGCLISAAVQKAMGKAYLFDFAADFPSLIPDYLYPEDAHHKKTIDLQHDEHFYCTVANLAAAIAVQSDELKKPDFKLEIADPLDNVFYAAPFRGLNKLTIDDYVPFLYTDSSVRTFDKVYTGQADLVVNEPSLPSGDYSRAKNFFAVRPHSSFNRYGKIEEKWFLGKNFKADGFLDKDSEKLALYDAIIQAGGKMPVTRSEFCKVWRDQNKKLEIDTIKKTFRGDTSTWCGFIGQLIYGKEKAPHAYIPEGKGDAWTFFGKIPEYDMFFGIMNGRVILRDFARLKYLLLGSSDVIVNAGKQKLVSLLAGNPVNIALKTDDTNLLTAKKIYVTFFRSKSCQLPAEVRFGRRITSVNACNRDGKVLATVPHSEDSFMNLWTQGAFISYYEVNF